LLVNAGADAAKLAERLTPPTDLFRQIGKSGFRLFGYSASPVACAAVMYHLGASKAEASRNGGPDSDAT
jgi:hypothetical protein